MSDYDGDIVFSTNDPTFIKCKFYDELPHNYEAAKNFGELLMKELEKEV